MEKTSVLVFSVPSFLREMGLKRVTVLCVSFILTSQPLDRLLRNQMNVAPQGTAPTLYFLTPYSLYSNMAVVRTCEAEALLIQL
jgi:hypothetical protein